MNRAFAAFWTFGLLCLPCAAWAEPFPTRQITVIVPWPAGTVTDSLARYVGSRLAATLRQPVVIENKAGADGNVGALSASRAAPDGYTLFFTTNSTHAANSNLYATLAYDPIKDFLPIARIYKIPLLLVVRADSAVNSVADLVDTIRRKPKTTSFGYGNTSTRIAAELLISRFEGLDVTRVPYRGNPQGLVDLMAGRIDFMFPDMTTGLEQVRTGQLKPLGVTSLSRAKQLPDVRTIAEEGLPGFEMIAWGAVFSPAGTPEPIVQRLSDELNGIVGDPDARAFFEKIGADAFPGRPAELADFVSSETAKWATIIKSAGIEPR